MDMDMLEDESIESVESDTSPHIHWNRLLPYEVPGGTEEFQSVLGRLRDAIVSADLVELSICSSCFDHILDQKMALSVGELEKLVNISWQLVINPPIDHSPTRSDWAQLALRILRMPIAASLNLSFDWRPIFDLLQVHLYVPNREAKLYVEENCFWSVIKLAERARRFFPPGMSQDLFKAIEPFLYPLQSRYFTQYIAMLVVFLPTSQYDNHLLGLLSFPSGILWTINSKRIDALNMVLLVRASKANQLKVDWDLWMGSLLALLRRHLKLPGPESGPKGIPKYNPDDKPGNQIIRNVNCDFVKSFAKWSVRAIRDDNRILEKLQNFIASLDSFFHPSNGGGWTAELAHLLSSLAAAMNKRLHRPNNLPSLSQETIERFVRCLWSVTSKLIFSKGIYGSLGGLETLKGLVSIWPEFILQEICLLIEPSLLSLTEPHRTNVCIGALAAVGRKLTTLPPNADGLPILSSLMASVIPGIDSNDTMKTINTLSFFSTLFTILPLHSNDDLLGDMESFVMMFIEQSCSFLATLGKSSDKDVAEAGVLQLFYNTWDVLFMQLSPDLLSLAFDRIWRWVKAEATVFSAKPSAILMAKPILCQPDKYLRIILPWILESLGPYCTVDFKSHVQQDSPIESLSKLIILLSCLHRTVQAGARIMSSDQMSSVIQVLIDLSDLNHFELSRIIGKCFKSLMKGICSCYPTNWSSWNPDEEPSVGQSMKIHQVQIQWHIPSMQTVQYCLNACVTWWRALQNCSWDRSRLELIRSFLKGLLALETCFDPTIITNAAILDESSHKTCQSLIEEVKLYLLSFDLSDKAHSAKLKRLLVSCLEICLTYRGIGRGRYGSLSKSISNLRNILVWYKKDPWKPRVWYVRRAYIQHLCRLYVGSFAPGRLDSRLTDRLFGMLVTEPIREISNQINSVLSNVHSFHADPLRAFISAWIKASNDCTDDDVIVNLLSATSKSVNACCCSDWDLLGPMIRFITELNERPGIERIPHIYNQISSLYVESAKNFSLPPGKLASSPNQILQSLLGLEGSLNLQDYLVKREARRSELISWICQKFDNSNWRTQSMLLTYLLILFDPNDPVSISERDTFLQGCSSDVYEVRFAALQGSKIAFHLWNKQRSSQFELFKPDLGQWALQLRPVDQPYTPKYSLSSLGVVDIDLIIKRMEIEEQDDPSKLDFRPEVSRLFQCIHDIVGPSTWSTIRLVPSDSWTPGQQRFVAEFFGGCFKSHLMITGSADLDVEELIRFPALAWCKSGPDAAKYWFASFFFSCRSRPAASLLKVYDYLVGHIVNCTGNELLLCLMALLGVVRAGGWFLDTTHFIVHVTQKLFPQDQSPVIRRESAILLRDICRNTFGHELALMMPTFDPSVEVRSVMEYMHACYADPIPTGIWHQMPHLIELIIRSHQSDLIELQLATKATVKRMAWMDCCPSQLALPIMSGVFGIADDRKASIHVRKLAIEFLRSFYARNYMQLEDTKPYLNGLLQLVSDEMLEVREAVSISLTSYFHSLPTIADHFAPELLKKLECTPSQSLPLRHSSLLQAKALILSAPYRLASWAPPLLYRLARLFAAERSTAAQATLRQIFSEFKRTHQDNWAMERMAFSPEQLEAVSELLISPSYYA